MVGERVYNEGWEVDKWFCWLMEKCRDERGGHSYSRRKIGRDISTWCCRIPKTMLVVQIASEFDIRVYNEDTNAHLHPIPYSNGGAKKLINIFIKF